MSDEKFQIDAVVEDLKATRGWGPGDLPEQIFRLATIVDRLQTRVAMLEAELTDAQKSLMEFTAIADPRGDHRE